MKLYALYNTETDKFLWVSKKMVFCWASYPSTDNLIDHTWELYGAERLDVSNYGFVERAEDFITDLKETLKYISNGETLWDTDLDLVYHTILQSAIHLKIVAVIDGKVDFRESFGLDTEMHWEYSHEENY